MAHYHEQRSVEWGHWGITFMRPQSDRTKNFGEIVGHVGFGVGNCGPVDGTVGSPLRAQYREMCRAWVERGVLPSNLVAA